MAMQLPDGSRGGTSKPTWMTRNPKFSPLNQNVQTRSVNNIRRTSGMAPLAPKAVPPRVPSPVRTAPTSRGAGGGRTTPVPPPSYGGGGSISPSATGSYGGYDSGAASFAAAAAAPPPPPPPPSLDEFLATDDIYATERAGIDKDLDALIQELTMARGNYDVDFGKTLRNLGWRGPQGGSIDDILTQGSFDPMDRQGAYGTALNSQVNDFAGRGMMNSSFFGKAQEDLETGFQRQRGDLLDTRKQFLDDTGRQEKNARDQAEQALIRARQSGAARRAAKYGIV